MNETLTGITAVDTFVEKVVSHAVAFIIIILVGFIIGRLAGRLIYKVLHDVSADKAIKELTKLAFPLETFASKFVSYFIYFLTVVMALNEIGITTTVFNILFAAFLLLLVITLLLSIKDFLPNAIAGIVIRNRGNIKKGNIVVIDKAKGRVEDISLTETKIVTENKDVIFIPNSTIWREKIVKKK